MEQPDEILQSFVDNLPITIRGSVLAILCASFDNFRARPDFDFSAAFREIIQRSDGPSRALNVAKVAGVLEVLLVHTPEDRERFPRLAAEHEHGEVLFAEEALKAPLKGHHYERARDDFQVLREGPLSPLALRLWWQDLQSQQPPISFDLPKF